MNKDCEGKVGFSDEDIKIVNLFQLVSSIPYGNVGQRSLDSVLEAKRASCSGKHILLGRLLELIDIEVKYFIGETDLSFLNEYLPEHLAIEKPTVDFHNFIKIRRCGEWLTVDATFGPHEAKLGFPSNMNWDGKRDCSVLFPSKNVLEITDIEVAKTQILSKTSREVLDKRKFALGKLVEYLDSAAKSS